MTTKDKNILYLSNHINKTFPLPDFMEKEINCDLTWTKDMQSALCNCPMPDHRDTNASFRVNLMDDIWVFHCFGCGKSGTLVTFCKEFYNFPNRTETIVWLCKKFDIKDTEDLILKGILSLNKRLDVQRKMENENIVISNLCRMLLKRDFEANQKFVSQTFKRINKLMEDEDFDEIQKIGEEIQSALNKRTK